MFRRGHGGFSFGAPQPVDSVQATGRAKRRSPEKNRLKITLRFERFVNRNFPF
jgi:hypothetical protein